MPIESTEIRRQSILNSPVSNTELNSERLPDAKALEGMELRYREETSSWAMLERYPLAALTTAVLLGSSYAMALHASPGLAAWLWLKAQEVEGMPVVGAMIAVMLLIIALLALVLIPKEIRRGFAALSLPLLVVPVSALYGLPTQGSLGVLCGFLSAYFWKLSAIRFHESWLAADPRMTTTQANTWTAKKTTGWKNPNSDEVARLVGRFLTYDSQAGTPGVWRAPSSRSVRIIWSGFVCGCVFSQVPIFGDALLLPPEGFLLVGLLTAAPLLALLVWAAGEASWRSHDAVEMSLHLLPHRPKLQVLLVLLLLFPN